MSEALAGCGNVRAVTSNAQESNLTIQTRLDAAFDACISCIDRTYNRRIPASFPSDSGRSKIQPDPPPVGQPLSP